MLHEQSTDELMSQAIMRTRALDDETEALCWRMMAEPDNDDVRARLNVLAHDEADIEGDDQLVVLAACSPEPVRRALLLGALAYFTTVD